MEVKKVANGVIAPAASFIPPFLFKNMTVTKFYFLVNFQKLEKSKEKVNNSQTTHKKVKVYKKINRKKVNESQTKVNASQRKSYSKNRTKQIGTSQSYKFSIH